ncbi:MAG: hypothetical protein IJP07_01030, partial [Firmicutes bacterium]|nr:hypothetical protein [Bacillota bacterium]
LSDTEKGALSLHNGKTDNHDKDVLIHTHKLSYSFDDQISGLSLQEALDQLGVTNIFTFPD